MIFKLFSRKSNRCDCCGKTFDELKPASIKERAAMQSNLLAADFTCASCNHHFHGKCGQVGSASPRGALVTCPVCKKTSHQGLNFEITREAS